MSDTLPLLNPAFQLRIDRRVWSLTRSPACSGNDLLERPSVLHLFVPWVQVVLRFRGHTSLASVRFRPRSSSLDFFDNGIRQAGRDPQVLHLFFFYRFVRRADSVGVSHGLLSARISLDKTAPRRHPTLCLPSIAMARPMFLSSGFLSTTTIEGGERSLA